MTNQIQLEKLAEELNQKYILKATFLEAKDINPRKMVLPLYGKDDKLLKGWICTTLDEDKKVIVADVLYETKDEGQDVFLKNKDATKLITLLENYRWLKC